FGTVVQEDIQVNVGTRSRVDFQLNPGQVEEVVVRGEAPVIDPKSTTTGASFNVDEYTDYVPVGRNFSDTFTLAPGVVSGGGTGAGNYSVSGSSGLENSYIVDGVNITNTGYGGIGSYNIVYGSLGTGVTYEFLDEVQVKTGGIDAEYGQATGGVINTIVKSGTNDFGGSLAAYITPSGTMEDFKRTSLSVGAVDRVEREQTDLAASVGGPAIKDKLFYFAAYNPVTTKESYVVEGIPLPPLLDVNVPTFPVATLGPQERQRTSNNWAAKLTWYLNPNHRFELSGFGDPSEGDLGPQNELSTKFLDFSAGGGQSKIEYGANNYSLKYDAVFSPQFFLSAQVGRHDGEFTEDVAIDFPRVRDRRQELCFLAGACAPGQPNDNAARWYYGGTGFISQATDKNDQFKLIATYVLGNHELKGGLQYDDVEYLDDQGYSGASQSYVIPLDGDGDSSYTAAAPDCSTVGPGTDCVVTLTSTSGALIDRRSDTNFRVIRARFYPTPPPTTTEELSFFAQDTWSITPRFNLKLGVRVTQQDIKGAGGFDIPFTTESRDLDADPLTPPVTIRVPGSKTFTGSEYSFDTEIAPRVGATWDVLGNGRSKVYANLGRYFERIPNDLAIRALSNEVGLSRYTFTGYDFNTGTLSGAQPGSTILFQGLETTTVNDGTKLPYVDEVVLGYQQEVNRDLAFEVRGIYREQGRALEDVQVNSIEAIQNFYYGTFYGYSQDPFPGQGLAPFGAYNLANPGENAGPGFPKAIREYKALELIANKRFSDHWLLYGNFRISSLRGNYEGLFRNDNGQSDPNITSLFDFPDSTLTRGQFQVGPLNTDRPYVLNLTSSYTWDNGLTIGGRFNWQSGSPRTPFLAHPIYVNAGELPGLNPVYSWLTTPGNGTGNDFTVADCVNGVSTAGSCWVNGTPNEASNDLNAETGIILRDYDAVGRGALGRLPDIATLDLEFGYDLKFGKQLVRLGATVFNVFNDQEITYINDNVESTAGVLDPDFGRPLNVANAQQAYNTPRSVRFSARWSF
ncbi:MAG TPA: hypothetical protein VFV75_03825, partial [Candidatus Polarisedimenticolaceae bacterium]|nr:hypothetical protein [Candidatus Polarisedimenticolaceae bacterium]